MEPSSPSQPSRKPRRRANQRVLKWVRRTHLYTGLLLLPWALLFGASGMLFNHGAWLSKNVRVEKLPPATVEEALGLERLDPQVVAAAVVAQLNARQSSEGESGLQLVQPSSATISGSLRFDARSEGATHSIQVSPVNGTAKITTRAAPERKAPDSAPFMEQPMTLAAADLHVDPVDVGTLLEAAGIQGASVPEPNGRSSPRLLFKVSDGEGRVWNTGYDLSTGEFSGRAADEPAPMDARSVMTRLHKVHHYPDSVGPRWFWTLAADATGATLVFWGISGLFMWWQLKPTRAAGILGLGFAGLLATAVTVGTLQDLNFGASPRRSPSRPAVAPTSSESSKATESGEPEKRLRSTPEEGLVRRDSNAVLGAVSVPPEAPESVGQGASEKSPVPSATGEVDAVASR